MRPDFFGTTGHKITSQELDQIDIGGAKKHYKPISLSDKFAFHAVSLLRKLPDFYFRDNHPLRACMLETIAAVPGMVGAMLRHMRSLRTLKQDTGWIMHLLHEAENERLHLMIWVKYVQPSMLHRLLILAAQGGFLSAFSVLYMVSPRTAHRFAGYLEEEAIHSYTLFLEAIENGEIENTKADSMAIEYYNMTPKATLRDVVVAVRSDEAVHRDCNHFLSDRIRLGDEDLQKVTKEALENRGTAK
ncbi:alternative oxidase-domain-containing protein [Syncephalastrum racemosum]|uniref:Alternative oxidase n=1 Tax=Syncephalastrum racemosum TaxID=13706 RepID=A0A1X2HQ03_SYNRA|nr:alternative oxidase-domain-containing protein [Syncephalastrum racemosum]